MKPVRANVNTVPNSNPSAVITIAIDGFAGTGKSSTAKAVANQLGYTYVDTGAMYRAITMYLLDHQIPLLDQTEALNHALQEVSLEFRSCEDGASRCIFLNGKNAEPAIREPRVTASVSQVAALTDVRHKLVEQQREIGANGGIVMDGRDIGTYVFPDAELKIFMKASVEVRANRRQAELKTKGIEVSTEDILSNLTERDRIDSSRKMAPLAQAEDAVVIDSSNMSFEEQVSTVVSLATKKIEHSLSS